MPAIFKSSTILAGLNAKTVKGDKFAEYATAIMYLAPWKAAGLNVCPMAEQAEKAVTRLSCLWCVIACESTHATMSLPAIENTIGHPAKPIASRR